jgi:acyl-CoA hydrolase
MYSGLYFRLMKALEVQELNISTKMISQLLECIDEKCELSIYNKNYVNTANSHDIYMALHHIQRPSNSMKLKDRIYEFYEDITLLSYKYSVMQDRLAEPRKEKNRQRRHRQKERKNQNRNGLRKKP